MDEIIGKIYLKSEADEKFGSVINSLEMNTNELKNVLSKTENYFMFKLEEKNLYLLNNKRETLFPEGFAAAPGEVFNILSKSKIEELLDRDNNKITYFEERDNIFSITNGGYTLEEILDCPPHCF